jgi:hypothetical protein
VIGHIKAEHRMGRNYLKAAMAIASMPCSPLPAITSALFCAGWRAFSCPVPGGLHDAEPAADLKTPLNRSSLSTEYALAEIRA